MAPSRVAPTDLRPPTNGGGAIILPAPEAAPQAGAAAAKLKLRVGDVIVEGGFPDLAAAAEALAAKLKRREVTVGEIYAAAADLEQDYLRAGFPLARVVVPPQQVAPGGALRIRVIDGYIESVDVAAAPERYRRYLSQRLASLIGRRPLRAAALERALLIAGDAPGLTLQSALAPGDAPGATRLIVSGTQKLVTGAFSSDDRQPLTLGGWQRNLSLAANNATGWGEQTYLALGLGTPFDPLAGAPPMYSLGGGAQIPLGLAGATGNLEALHSVTRPYTARGAPGSLGALDRVAMRASYPVIRSRLQTLSVEGQLYGLKQSESYPQFDRLVSLDAYGAAQLSLLWRAATPWGGGFDAHVHVDKGLGGREPSDETGLSRLGASPDFLKTSYEVALTQPLAEGVSADFKSRGQWSFGRPLMVSEQIQLDGPDAISAAPAGALGVDAGIVGRAELSRAWQAQGPANAVWAPYLFAAAGLGQLYRATRVETADERVAGYGAGLRLSFPTLTAGGADLGLEWAFERSNVPTQKREQRFWLQSSVRF